VFYLCLVAVDVCWLFSQTAASLSSRKVCHFLIDQK
jgi:hypothetical protein